MTPSTSQTTPSSWYTLVGRVSVPPCTNTTHADGLAVSAMPGLASTSPSWVTSWT
eukprot:CAMPEP_0175834314 /NCGR_PEP_ID=MMETSP0107_2-20121207/15992_1 /TAXON_ID=195067 ORGANISM="Goniomonas pacifica, Strain CCMP1869" /NCGR_SAMPLE_ID=MMETSP0107_2 /ASSEMBLY_ACC=CAM_ASM_000203 /LENGTH=54 /DNA_ID=CAMNT_0017147531 /DNA_START=219 /DNA_END=383 /DNA_ORIENTATION=+